MEWPGKINDISFAAYRFCYVFVACNVFCLLGAGAQHIPDFTETGRFSVQSFSAEVYDAPVQNWSTVQAQNGLIYFGNIGNVLEYDGVSWRVIPIANGTPVRSLAEGPNGRIYVGAIGEFGYLAPDSTGSMAYRSLLDSLGSEDRIISDIRSIQKTEEGIYFQARERLFRLNEDGFHVWRPDTGYKKNTFVLRDILHVQLEDAGLMQMRGDSLVQAPGGATFKDKLIVGLFPEGDSAYIAVTVENGIFLCQLNQSKDKTCTSIPSPLVDMQVEPSHSTMLTDSIIVVGTRDDGVILLNKTGELLRIVDQASGLRHNRVWHTYIDRSGGLWVTLNDGVARVDVSSPNSYFDKDMGIDEPVEEIIRHRGRLYISTIAGIYVLAPSDGKVLPRFVKIPGPGADCYALVAINERLLAGCADSIYDVEQGKPIASFSGTQVYSIHVPAKDTNQMYVGLADGMKRMELKEGTWNAVEELDIKVPARSIREDAAGDFWMLAPSVGVLKYTAGAPPQDRRFTAYGTDYGLPDGWIYVKKVDGQMRFFSDEGSPIYKASTSDDSITFVPDNRFDEVPTEVFQKLYNLTEDEEGRIWMFAGKASGVAIPKTDGTFSFQPTALRQAPVKSAYAVYAEPAGPLWVGGPHGLVRLERTIKNSSSASYPTWIRRITTANDSILFGGHHMPHSGNPVWSHHTKTLRFSFASARYDTPELVQYRTLLDGSDDNWSAWNSETHRDFTNLREGDYKFKVQARDIYGQLGQEASYSFVILPPWYRTKWAYVLWALLIGGTIAGLVLGYNHYQTRLIQARNRLLENRVARRTEELREKKEAIEQAYEELTWTNAELLRSNQALEERTNQLKKALETNKEILGITAHDLKNPLGGIIGLASLMMLDATDDSITLEKSFNEHMPSLKDEAERMLQIIKDLLDTHRNEEEVVLRKEKVLINDIVAPILRRNEQQAQVKSIDLHYASETNTMVEIDVMAIQRVLDNYVSNAIKYSPHHSNVWITIKSANLIPGDDEITDSVCVMVKDEGPGLTEADKQKVFGKLQRLSAKPTNGEHSTGLGLYIVKSLVEAHGGQVGVTSKAGEGAAFWFKLPVLLQECEA